MPDTWILLANGHRARFLQHDSAEGALIEWARFIYPAANLSMRAGAVQSLAKVGKAHTRFARQLADYLNKAVADRRCDQVALIASSPMLDVLRPMLSPGVHDILLNCVDSDFTHCQGNDLQHRIQQALGPLD